MENKKLEKNFLKMFWIGAFFNFRLVNLITTLFYLSRSLNLSQIFYLAIIFSASNILFEIPSSYMADRWGRKKTLILSTSFFSLSFLIFLLSHSFMSFAFAMFVYGLAHALMSGTDEALIYDTSKQLGNGKESLKSLAKYQSSESLFKIFTPILAAVLARDITEAQFVLVYVINIIFSLPAIFIAASLIEPNRFLDLEKKEEGILKDAWKTLKTDKNIRHIAFNKTLFFISSVAIFLVHQKIFIDLGVSLLIIGLASAFGFAVRYFVTSRYDKFFSDNKFKKHIDNINYLNLSLLFIAAINAIVNPNGWFLLAVYIFVSVAISISQPLFSNFFNQNSYSFNRATFISMTGFLKSILDIPIMLISAYIISINQNYVFSIAFVICLITVIFFRIPVADSAIIKER